MCKLTYSRELTWLQFLEANITASKRNWTATLWKHHNSGVETCYVMFLNCRLSVGFQWVGFFPSTGVLKGSADEKMAPEPSFTSGWVGNGWNFNLGWTIPLTNNNSYGCAHTDEHYDCLNSCDKHRHTLQLRCQENKYWWLTDKMDINDLLSLYSAKWKKRKTRSPVSCHVG